MWGEIVTRLPRFASAVLTGLDSGGDPVSLRCRPTLDHHAQLWKLQSFLLRGTLEPTGHGWVFRPRQLVPGMDTTPLSNLRLLRNGRRTAKRYLAARGLPRPTIPWEHYAGLKEQATGRG